MRMRRCGRESGQVVLLVLFSLVVLIGTVGLAIDSAVGYLIKAKLNAAVDSAVIAAARTVSQGSTQDVQRANAITAAREFFDANYPSGYMGSTAQFSDPDIVFDGGKVVLSAAATATVPTRFMRVLDVGSFNVGANAQVVRKDLDMAVVIDTTGSMNTGSVPGQVRSNTKLFLTKFNQTMDRVALIQYAYGAVTRDGFRPVQRGFDIASMNSHIDAFTFAGSTNSSEGVWHARDQLNNVIQAASRSSMRVIVFFSDGAPNSFASSFAFNTGAGTCTAAGTISTGDDTTSNWPAGLRAQDAISANSPSPCWQNTSIANPAATTHINKLPDWYNAHNPTDLPALREFPVVTNTPRIVTSDTSTRDSAWRNVNRAARNLLEAMAEKSRNEGIYVFTLGLGNALTLPTGPDSEKGEDILKCMANVADAPARCLRAAQPVGTYCHAADENELKPCFDKLASAILRITK
ncbi:VWA domain-containing protein [Massilia sp. R2A-15]|uniref:vWA domain-containing protein n=1 Tax=Massilia sp. R2A-15 TaxID=3064278 RepID=UPI0027360F87|nr:vWA domain-containing protein [Massilia sp. R2A-15]WLI87757.1 VWA domain-containing protein [Massilia sp. R2A-15]